MTSRACSAELAGSSCFDQCVPREELAHVLRAHLAGDDRLVEQAGAGTE